MTTAWNPAQYEKFKAQRSKPFFDLAHLLQGEAFDTAVDLGCGTGELTRKLFDRLHPRKMTGIDSSKEMLEKSTAVATPGLDFQLKNISEYRPEAPLDLLFSNAALHWVPDHEVVEWTKGSLLTAYQARLPTDQFVRFVEAYRTELLGKIGKGPYFYAFKRILLWGRKNQ